MRDLLLLVLLACLLLLAPRALADPPSSSPGPATPSGAGESSDGIAAVEEGQPAPFAGILLSEERFTAVANLQIRLDEAEGKLENRNRLLDEMTGRVTEAAAREAEAAARASDPGWWGRHGFTVGVVVGAAATVALVWATFESVRE